MPPPQSLQPSGRQLLRLPQNVPTGQDAPPPQSTRPGGTQPAPSRAHSAPGWQNLSPHWTSGAQLLPSAEQSWFSPHAKPLPQYSPPIGTHVLPSGAHDSPSPKRQTRPFPQSSGRAWTQPPAAHFVPAGQARPLPQSVHARDRQPPPEKQPKPLPQTEPLAHSTSLGAMQMLLARAGQCSGAGQNGERPASQHSAPARMQGESPVSPARGQNFGVLVGQQSATFSTQAVPGSQTQLPLCRQRSSSQQVPPGGTSFVKQVPPDALR